MVFSGAFVRSPRWAMISGKGNAPGGKSQRVMRREVIPDFNLDPPNLGYGYHTEEGLNVSIMYISELGV